MNLVTEKAEAYAMMLTSPLDAVCSANLKYTMAEHEHAQMHSGHVQGKVLESLSIMINPLRILEIGTFTGFSALCLYKGLAENGTLHTIEIRKTDADVAATYFKQAHANRIIQHIGNAIEIIPQLTEKWDLVFIDADKVSYIDYYELTLPRLNTGGWIIADNVLFHGDVLHENIRGRNAKAIHAFNEHVLKDDRVSQVILTVRDGLMLIKKL